MAFRACRLKGTKPASSRYLGNTKGDLSRERPATVFPIDSFDDLLSHKSGRIRSARFRGAVGFFPVSPERRAHERAAKARIKSAFVSTAVVGRLEVRKCWILRVGYGSSDANYARFRRGNGRATRSGCPGLVLSDGQRSGCECALGTGRPPVAMTVIVTLRCRKRRWSRRRCAAGSVSNRKRSLAARAEY